MTADADAPVPSIKFSRTGHDQRPNMAGTYNMFMVKAEAFAQVQRASWVVAFPASPGASCAASGPAPIAASLVAIGIGFIDSILERPMGGGLPGWRSEGSEWWC